MSQCLSRRRLVHHHSNFRERIFRSMIAEIIPEAYDAEGKQVSQPFHGRKGLHPTFPMGRNFSQPLTFRCKSLEELRVFLCGCRPVSDEKLFGKREYWQPPDEFEKRKAGDCEDFSLRTWRQLLDMGYDARIVFGRSGRYGIGHAWVCLLQNDKCYLLEPQAAPLGLKLPRLSSLRYQPRYSISSIGGELKYYAHKNPAESHMPLPLAIRLLPEWCRIWGRFWLRTTVRLPYWIARRMLRSLASKNPQPTGSL